MAAAAEGVEGEVPGEEQSGGGGSSKLLLIGLPVALLIGGAAGAYFADLLPFGAADEAPEVDGGTPAPTFATTTVFPLDPFIANLADDGGGRYLKATIQMEFAGPELPSWLEQRMPQIRDLILTLLTSKSFDEIRSPEGKQILRDEILRRANQALQAEQVVAVYFTEFIVQ